MAVPILLRNLHIAAAVIHLISCVLSIWIHTDTITGKITLPHHKYMSDPDATVKSLIVNSTLTHETILYTHPMVWVAGNEGFTFFSHMIALFLMRESINLDTFERLRRTIEYCFTAGILQVALVLGVGSMAMYDVFMLLIVNVAIQLLGWLADVTTDRTIVPYLHGIAFGLLVLEIFYVVLQSVNLDGIEPEPYIAMGIIYGIFYLLFGIVKLIPQWKRDENEVYILMSVSSKVALSWILIGNTYEGLKELNIKSEPFDHTELPWREIQYVISGICGAILLIGIPLIVNRPDEDGNSMDLNNVLEERGERMKRFKYNKINPTF